MVFGRDLTLETNIIICFGLTPSGRPLLKAADFMHLQFTRIDLRIYVETTLNCMWVGAFPKITIIDAAFTPQNRGPVIHKAH